MLAVNNPSGAERVCHRLDRQPSVCQEARLMGLIVQSLSPPSIENSGRQTAPKRCV